MDKFDVAVVGSGPVGVATALKLAQSGLKVAFILGDSKQYRRDLAIANGNKPEKHENIESNRSFRVGGTSNLWGGRLVNLDPIDFHPRSIVGNNLWPFDFREYSKFVKSGYEFFGISQSVVQNLFEIEGPPNLDISTFEIWTNYRNMFVAHNKLMKSYRNLTIFENTVTTKIIPINDEVEIRISKEPKSYKFIRSKKLVLCCGTIENNRIVINLENQNPGILKSKIKPGSYYLTHIMNHINFIKLENSIYQKKTVGGIQTRRRIRLSDDCQDKLSILNSAAFFAHNASGNFSQVFQDPFATIHKIFNNYGTNLPKYLWNYRHSLLNLKNVSTEMPVGEVLHLQSEMAPNTDSGIELLDKADGWGNYLVEPKLSFSEVDFKTVRLTLLTIIEELDIECNKDDINSELDSQLRMLADKPESQHQLGGLRIGNSKEFSLTDSYGALFGVPQIYCLGGSMFPTAGQANSTLPMVVLALRSAAKIIQEF